jgi:hypothetical protein
MEKIIPAKKKKNTTFYTNKIDSYFDQLSLVNLLSIQDITLRHGTIKSQLRIMDGLIPLLTSVSPYLKRSKTNYYTQLTKFEDIVRRYRSYITAFDLLTIEQVASRQQEEDVQLQLMNKISSYENFIDRELAWIPLPPPKEEDRIDIQGGAALSLADLKLI